MSSRHEGKFYEVFQVDLQDQVYRSSKYQVRFVVSINKESRLWPDTALGARHTSSVVDIILDNWCNRSRRID